MNPEGVKLSAYDFSNIYTSTSYVPMTITDFPDLETVELSSCIQIILRELGS